uniref:Aquaporin n=1 Tax=Syphacia muris TaxID=451379 RepID=A0A0N5AHK0_9BILA
MDEYGPLLVASCFYVVVFILGHVSRQFIRRNLDPSSSRYKFLIEAITTAQMCTCVYENGTLICFLIEIYFKRCQLYLNADSLPFEAVITRNYGPWGFLFVVSTVLTVGTNVNGGGYVSPLTPIELYVKKSLSLKSLLEIIFGQVVGGYAAFRIARNLWYSTSRFSSEHLLSYESTKCAFVYKVPFFVAFAFEFIGCFLLRYINAKIPIRYKKYIAPVLTASFLSFSLAFIGVVGLNPTVSASRMFGCDGLNTLWFIATYWVCPTLGWLAGATFDSSYHSISEKTNKQA